MGRSDIIDISVHLKHETEAAILVSDGTKEAWLSKRLIEYEKDKGKTTYTVSLPEWLAVEKGLV